MVLLNLGINISFRATNGLPLLEISYLDRFFIYLYLTVTIMHNFWKCNSLYVLLEDVLLQIRNQMWFMQDGAPAHSSRFAREFLNNNYIIDGLVEEDPLLGLHILPIFTYGDILRLLCMILLLLLWKYSEIVLSLHVKKYKILWEFFNIFDNLCDVGVKHALTRKEIISSNFCKINKKSL